MIHFLNNPKQFIGFSLQNFLDSIITSNQFDTTGAVVVFECVDGYRPTMPIAQVFRDKKGFITTRDLNATAGKNWIDSLDKKMKPFYLVWQDVPKEDHSYMWPYGLYAMRLVPAGTAFKDAYPFDTPDMVAGFQLFNQNCMKCHSVNKVGGVMGPEMNIPKNITEYWTDENIIAFAKNPQSFRYRSSMAPITGVSDEDFQQILAYLKYIAAHKVDM
jgi:mono/diheme cytochrome c family protein